MAKLAMTGPALAGKTTLAQYLATHHGFVFLPYNDLLKGLAAMALSSIGQPTGVQDIVADKQRYRPLLQELGVLLGFDEGWGLTDLASGVPEGQSVVLDNVRFRAQWDKLAPLGYTLVRLIFSPLEQEARAARLGLSTAALGKAMQHPAEMGFRTESDEIVVPGTWETEVAAAHVLGVLRARRATT